jgi:hypothetical protein
MVLQFFVCGHTTCFGLHGHLQVCKIFSFFYYYSYYYMEQACHTKIEGYCKPSEENWMFSEMNLLKLVKTTELKINKQ